VLLGFLGTIALVTTLLHLYLWKRLVRDTTAARSRGRRIGGLVILALALAVPGTLVGSRVGPDWLAWGYLWISVMFYLFVTLLVLEIPMLAAKLWLRARAGRAAPGPAAQPAPVLVATGESPASSGAAAPPAENPPAGPSPAGPPPGTEGPSRPADGPAPLTPSGQDRRLLLARGAAIFAGLTAVSVTGYGVRTALGPPTVDRVRVPLRKLPRRMDGFRIATVSDIHLGPLAGRAHSERIVAAINRLDADLVAIVGDLVDGTVGELGSAAAPLAGIRSRRGTFFVTGNHEYYSGVEQWLAELPRLGMRVLQNERLEIDGLDLAGVNDITGGEPTGPAQPAGPATTGPDFSAALGGRDPRRPVVLLAHQPVQATEAAKHGVDLQLSGHTHGGQMAPFNLLVKLQQPIVSGLGEVDGTKVYVTNGAGFWGPPVRVGAKPQVSLVELRSA
jgi:predicted MPP superfamily phosphohydrolase